MRTLLKLSNFCLRIRHQITLLILTPCRAKVDEQLAKLVHFSTTIFNGTTLVDATYDGPNYWFRFSLLRVAKGLSYGREIGVIGPFRQKEIRQTLDKLGIHEHVYFPTHSEPLDEYLCIAQAYVESLTSPDDLLTWRLPFGIPTWDLYDSILKHQRQAYLDINHPDLIFHVAKYLRDLYATERIVRDIQPNLAVLSHTASGRTNIGTIVWHLLRRGIPIIVPQGGFGNLTHFKITKYEDIFSHPNRPTPSDIANLPLERRNLLQQAGKSYIERRLNGNARDLAAIQAFKDGRAFIDLPTLCSLYGWQCDKPIIGVFASVWFDNPHTYGMTEFRDFYDWLQVTIQIATQSDHVNWLFKPHPSEGWYGGVTLSDMLPGSLPSHIRIASEQWDGACLRKCLHGIVTLHGTAGVEMTAIGKPVLAASRGWYTDIGFVKYTATRREYELSLSSQWWQEINMSKAQTLAQIFAGFYFCQPASPHNITLMDDSYQHKLYPGLLDLLVNHHDKILNEIDTMNAWLKSDIQHYHVYKMCLADSYYIPD